MLGHYDHVRAKAAPWLNSIEIAAFGKLSNGDTKAAVVQWQTISEAAELPTLLALSISQAQVLMDDLWNAGIRPTEGAGTAGAMRAAERHIEDLRTIAFRLLEVK